MVRHTRSRAAIVVGIAVVGTAVADTVVVAVVVVVVHGMRKRGGGGRV